MKSPRGLALFLAFFLFACQPATPPTVTIIDGDQVITLQTDERVPSAILAQAGIALNPNDRLLLNGLPIAPNSPVANSPITLQLRRAVAITIASPQGEQIIQTSAFTVGEALQEAGMQLSANDKVDPPLNSPIPRSSDSPITIYPSRELTVSVDGKVVQFRSSAKTVGEALAEAGIPLLGLDYSLPSENEALPVNGQVKAVRVGESILLAQKPIPFESELVASADVPLDQTQILSPGENGLSVQRVRVRYEDGAEVSRVTEEETLVRAPRTRTLAYGTKVEIKTAVVDGVTIEYWRAVQMYATSYSPCRLGVPGLCSNITASGLPLRKGVAGTIRSWYNVMKGQELYIPGYGFAVLADLGAGYPDGRPLIDLGYSDDDYVPWHSWVTVYFLTPVPDSIIYILK